MTSDIFCLTIDIIFVFLFLQCHFIPILIGFPSIIGVNDEENSVNGCYSRYVHFTFAYSRRPSVRVFQFPTDKLPVLDGDISEWDVVPDEMWINLDDPDIVVGEGDVGREKDRSNLYFRYAGLE